MPNTILGIGEATVNLSDIMPLHRTLLVEEVNFKKAIDFTILVNIIKGKKEAKIEENLDH